MPYSHRAAFAKFRCGVAPIRIETGRYENLDVGQRLCHFCDAEHIEDEPSVILICSLYNNLRCALFSKDALVLPNFNNLTDSAKTSFLLSHAEMIRLCAKTFFKDSAKT